MPVKLRIEHKLNNASFYEGENLLFKGFAKSGFLDVKWFLADPLDNIIASLDYHRAWNRGKIVMKFQKPAKDLVIFYNSKKGARLIFPYNNDNYLIIFHRENRYSFFRNEVQFGFMKKKNITIGSSKESYAYADQDTSVELLVFICYSIIIKTESIWQRPAELNIDYGDIGPEFREFDSSWAPT